MILPAVFLCLISISLASDEGACYVTSEMEDECGSVFYPIVKPLLRYFEVCQTKDRKNADLQDSLDELNLKYSKLLEKHSASQDNCIVVALKYAEIQEKFQQRGPNETNSKNEQLQNKLIELNRQNARLQEQSSNKDVELRSLRAQIAQQAAQITQLKDQTSDLKQTCELGKLKDLFSEEIAKLREVVKSGSGTEPNTTQSKSTQVDLPDRCPSTQDEFVVYLEIYFPGLEPFQVRCYSKEDVGSGWMMVFSKYYYSTELNQTYDQYINGFGDVKYAHFIGLEKLHILTSQKPHEVMVYEYFENNRVICESFVVGGRSEGYSLKQIDGCRGDTSRFNLIQGTKFSTFDRDQDGNPDHNWAQELGYGFWFGSEKLVDDLIWNSSRFFHFYIRRKD
ncbi:uncharacterized protein Dana_GF22132 [Drosophila ananassae]|uniref:Fibrinogen C-terminal domain-containing protein n=1 Tax=Drosophila ananassae TaxID=7217 RepID=B3MYG1_DROAN|nr:angiopoietin-related protein 4 [Drosophila ananassae]EDV32655.2 uncharacterized protein Dana_GF22132 [Drosophila ananassae]